MQQNALVQIFYFLQKIPLKPLDEFSKCLLNGIGFVGYAQKFLYNQFQLFKMRKLKLITLL
ncbi:hypothetical protein FIM48_04795 [Helicobacter pylori]|uniref:hypothetical protein n=1 Tax=Helicobacter pylori TaxID=210 RepID=UPI00112E9766|nr:hypothetical protein [Helicobacter pylori]TPH87171.1 hypothetical protein FIM48_04795 [Helicobacter pylori]